MCLMIVVALKPNLRSECLNNLPQGQRLLASTYRTLGSSFNGYPIWVIGTGSGCSCALYKPFSTADRDRAVAKYRRSGWSQSKIHRAMAGVKVKGFAGNLDPDFRAWFAAAVEEIGDGYLMVHWDADDLPVTSPTEVNLNEFTLATYPVDSECVYHIVGKGNRDN